MAFYFSRKIALGFILVGLVAACGSEPEVAVEPESEPKVSTRFEFQAKVAGMAPERLEVVLDHEEIVGYMDAMTMPFAVESEDLLTGIQLGNQVTGVIEVTDDKAVVVQLSQVEQIEEPKFVPGEPLVVIVETSKGTFEFETYSSEAPKTVEHIFRLVTRGFYDGQRFHRVVPKFVVQWGDPQSRDMTKKSRWGSGGSGKSIGVAEISEKRTHKLHAVAMAHAGDPARADSQMYVTLAPQPNLDGQYTVFGQVISGADVPGKLEAGDMIKKMYIKESESS